MDKFKVAIHSKLGKLLSMKSLNGTERFREFIIPEQKLVGYLLSETHLVGRAKAKFFRNVGFDEIGVPKLAGALEKVANTGHVEILKTLYGKKYIIDGRMETPSGRTPLIRTVWMEVEPKVLRFVTAYPLNKKG